jgi:Protein of unknown function (DUF2971)
MKPEWKYLTPNDETTILGLIEEWMPRFAPSAPTHLYHYTIGENLIRIIESRKLWSTQIACLNDTAEVHYAVDELHSRVRARRAGEHRLYTDPLLRRLDEVLSNSQLKTAPLFIACFSEEKDDLSQWRAYSGSEAGYAIPFDTQKLAKCGLGSECLLLKVEYEPENQANLLDDIVNRAEQYYINCEGRQRAPSLDEWTQEFVHFYLWRIEIFVACLKHPAFRAEKEWRLVCYLSADNPTPMRFLQRRSMMSRHLPLALNGQLPVTGVLVGPCRYPTLSRIAVNDLLQANGYDAAIAKVDVTDIPYRTI